MYLAGRLKVGTVWVGGYDLPAAVSDTAAAAVVPKQFILTV